MLPPRYCPAPAFCRRPLSDEEARFILERQWRQAGLGFDAEDFTDAEATAAIIRATGGNFRPLERLPTQVERIRAITGPRTITREVVEAARASPSAAGKRHSILEVTP